MLGDQDLAREGQPGSEAQEQVMGGGGQVHGKEGGQGPHEAGNTGRSWVKLRGWVLPGMDVFTVLNKPYEPTGLASHTTHVHNQGPNKFYFTLQPRRKDVFSPSDSNFPHLIKKIPCQHSTL